MMSQDEGLEWLNCTAPTKLKCLETLSLDRLGTYNEAEKDGVKRERLKWLDRTTNISVKLDINLMVWRSRM